MNSSPPDDRQALLRIARDAITADVCGLQWDLPELTAGLARRSGAFVSLHREHKLRGCIGHLEADEPAAVIVMRCAVSASKSDPRFPPVTPSELPDLHIEISLLGPLESIQTIDEVDVGRHGLVVERGWNRGLLLPQVAAERHWDAATFAAETCRKAGLSADAWKTGVKLWRFEADVFGEPEV